LLPSGWLRFSAKRLRRDLTAFHEMPTAEPCGSTRDAP
jgi:hypothetical protein